MGILTLAEFQEEVKEETGRDPGTPRLNRLINAGYREVAYAFQFRELEATHPFSTAAGTYTEPLSNFPNFRMLHEVGIWIVGPDDNSPKELIPESRRRYIENQELHQTDAQGVPGWYHIYGGNLYLRPIPDDAYDLEAHYWRRVTDLSNPTDVTFLSDDWDEAVKTASIYRMFRAYGEFDRYQNVRKDFLGIVRSRMLEIDVEPFPEGGIDVAREEWDV